MSEKIICPHNSMTGEKEKNWIARLFGAFCKCQHATIDSGLEDGVYAWDIRVWWGKDECWHYGHGLAEYKHERQPKDLVEYLYRQKPLGKTLYVRLLLERPCNNGVEHFKTLCEELEQAYWNKKVVFWEGRNKKTWERIYTFDAEKETPIKKHLPVVNEYHASVSGKWPLKRFPFLFWAIKGYKRELTEGINIIDFANDLY